jgi:hypothetical protein
MNVEQLSNVADPGSVTGRQDHGRRVSTKKSTRTPSRKEQGGGGNVHPSQGARENVEPKAREVKQALVEEMCGTLFSLMSWIWTGNQAYGRMELALDNAQGQYFTTTRNDEGKTCFLLLLDNARM